RYVLDIGMTGDLLELGLAIAPCLLGYGQIGNRLYNDPNTVRGDANPYWEWIENYHASDYQSAVDRGIGRYQYLKMGEKVLGRQVVNKLIHTLSSLFVSTQNFLKQTWSV